MDQGFGCASSSPMELGFSSGVGGACSPPHPHSWLHPGEYRTRLCKDETGCARRVCFFAHKPDELHAVNPSLASVSAGLALPPLPSLAPPTTPPPPPPPPPLSSSSSSSGPCRRRRRHPPPRAAPGGAPPAGRVHR
uniref:C3H1-type domain-containing protein n=1 Tax=Ananas comosus var. bracteatus TaxID=296719 RepID=A0A6V7QAZ1_ANACO|nr:unnamed protein product [Ananas comosus var. bracteatus]